VHVIAPGHDAVTLEALAVGERLVVVPVSLHPLPAKLAVTAPGARVEIDGRALASTTTLDAGEHRITVTARGHRTVTRTIDLAPGEDRALAIDLAATAQRRAAMYTLYGAAGLAGGALLAGALAWRAQSDAESIPAPPERMASDLDR